MQQSWRQACLRVFDRHQKYVLQPCWAQCQRRTFAISVVCCAAPRATTAKSIVRMEDFPCEVIRYVHVWLAFWEDKVPTSDAQKFFHHCTHR